MARQQGQPHLSVPRGQGVDEEGGCHHHPEEEVQRRPQDLEPEPDPQHPEQVIEHAHRQPQQHRTPQGGGLLGDGEAHQRNRREKKPPFSLPLSS